MTDSLGRQQNEYVEFLFLFFGNGGGAMRFISYSSYFKDSVRISEQNVTPAPFTHLLGEVSFSLLILIYSKQTRSITFIMTLTLYIRYVVSA